MTVIVAGCGGEPFTPEGTGGTGAQGGSGPSSTGGPGSGGTGGIGECATDGDCGALSDACHVGQCIGAKCVRTPGNDGAACDDDDPCTEQGVCSGGDCASGPAVDCSGLDGPCAVGSCDPRKGCVAVPANGGQTCDDGSVCTVEDACHAGACTGNAKVCPMPDDPCKASICDPNANGCTLIPANDGASCDDDSACTTADICSAGLCGGTKIVQCLSGDGCCAPGCTGVSDSDCACLTNLALTALASSSGGGTGALGPAVMNDGQGEASCGYHWVTNSDTAGGAWIELDWPVPVQIGSIYIDTQPAGMAVCAQAGRNVAGGDVQWWNGTTWVGAISFVGETDDVAIDIVPPVTTKKIRVFNVVAGTGGYNSLIFEWYVYDSPGCSPN